MAQTTSSDRSSDRPAAPSSPDSAPFAEPKPDEQTVDSSKMARATGSHVRWWLAVAVGLVVTVPLAWLLSYAAMLLFYLGLFFFALFGLIIGAVVYRIASRGRPYRRAALIVGTTIIALFGWAFSVVKESRDFPSDVAEKAADNPRLRLGDRSIDEYRAEVAQHVREFLRERYPPGGTIGYFRWIATSGEISSVEMPSVKRVLKRSPRKHWWVIRVVLSVGLLAFGVGSQTLLLGRVGRDPPAS